MSAPVLRTVINFLRFIGKHNSVADLHRIHPSAVIQSSSLEKCAAAARNSSVAFSTIGRYTSIGRNTKVTHADIGSFCSVSWDCTINAVSHPIERITTSAFPYVPGMGGFVDEREQAHERVLIGHDVWIGAQVIIMPGLQIHHGAVIGAGAIVTRDVQAYEVVVGSPAKHLKWRFDRELRDKLLVLKWWDWSDSQLQQNIQLFQKPLSTEDMDNLLRA